VGGVAFDHLLIRFLISRFVPETFAIKVWSCRKSRRILHGSALRNLRGAGLPRIGTQFYLCLAAYHVDNFGEVIPTGPKVISLNSLNKLIGPIFKFSLLKNCWGTPVTSVMYVSKPWPFYITCKNLKGQHPLGAKIWSSEKVDFGCSPHFLLGHPNFWPNF